MGRERRDREAGKGLFKPGPIEILIEELFRKDFVLKKKWIL